MVPAMLGELIFLSFGVASYLCSGSHPTMALIGVEGIFGLFMLADGTQAFLRVRSMNRKGTDLYGVVLQPPGPPPAKGRS